MTVTTDRLTLTAADGHRLAAFQARPAGAPLGGVVVLQEIFGVNSHIQAVCHRLAEAGWAALAPALFDRAAREVTLGYEAADVEQGKALKQQIAPDTALQDVAAARAALAEHTAAVAVIGFCWGGSLAWAAATRLEGFAASLSYYGGEVPRLAEETPGCPVLLHFGQEDAGIPLDGVAAFHRRHPALPLHLYPAGHGFNCDQRASYAPDSAARAWRRSLAFLDAVMPEA